MRDPWGSFQNFMSNFQQMAKNPVEYMMKNYGINLSNPNDIIQQVMSSGKLTQEQYNAAKQAASKIQSNPLFNQMMGMKK